MLWILFGLVVGNRSFDFHKGNWTCTSTICENIPGSEIYLLKSKIWKLYKFLILGIINCSDCGMYNILLYDTKKSEYIDNITIEDYKTRVEYRSKTYDCSEYEFYISTKEKFQIKSDASFNFFWCDPYIRPTTQSPTPTNSPTQIFTNSNLFSASNLFSNSDKFASSKLFSNSNYFSDSKKFSSSNYFSQSKKFSPSNYFSPSNFLIPNRTPLQNIVDDEILNSKQEKSNKTLTIILSTILPCIGIIILIIFLIIIIKRHQKINQKTDSDTSVVFDIQKENDSIKVDQENPLYNQEVDPFLRMMEEEIIN